MGKHLFAFLIHVLERVLHLGQKIADRSQRVEKQPGSLVS